ncbi:hypothetical protein C0991_003095 [Blastosporella zonata]|nr:hypothetical protein C0991_003095 [Blastosporella zonata]
MIYPPEKVPLPEADESDEEDEEKSSGYSGEKYKSARDILAKLASIAYGETFLPSPKPTSASPAKLSRASLASLAFSVRSSFLAGKKAVRDILEIPPDIYRGDFIPKEWSKSHVQLEDLSEFCKMSADFLFPRIMLTYSAWPGISSARDSSALILIKRDFWPDMRNAVPDTHPCKYKPFILLPYPLTES